MDAPKAYDVCIVGAGPGGLAALSAVLEPYSVDLLSAGQADRAAFAKTCRGRKAAAGTSLPRVCVVDPSSWLSIWKSRFKALQIKWLRSPALAHPDLFDALSLQSFAYTHGRQAELFDSGAGDTTTLRGLREVSDGAWQLPSNALFQDFCQEQVDRLPHDFYQAGVMDVQGRDGSFVVDLDNGLQLEASAVVLAVGVPGLPAIPACMTGLPEHLAFHADLQSGSALATLAPGERVLVIGGGLTAVQTAQLAHRRGCQTVLLSRRPLTTRHFDIDVEWFDRRRTQGKLYEFLSLPVEERLRMIRKTRGGGSVPKMYMDDLRVRAASGRLNVICGEAEVLFHDGNTVHVQIDGSTHTFDKIVSACGHRPDCTSLQLVGNLQRQWPVPIHGGLPALSQDVQWAGLKRLFVIGALAALQVGPDAGNLMGLRRAAHTVVSALDSRGWLRDSSTVLGNIRGNRFSALDDGDDEDDGSESDEDVPADSFSESCKGSGGRSCRHASRTTAGSFSGTSSTSWNDEGSNSE